jgi:hypothetical protein
LPSDPQPGVAVILFAVTIDAEVAARRDQDSGGQETLGEHVPLDFLQCPPGVMIVPAVAGIGVDARLELQLVCRKRSERTISARRVPLALIPAFFKG